MISKRYLPLRVNALLFSVLPLALLLVLGGCSTTYFGPGTPVVQKHAKRGYNKSYKIKGRTYYPRNQYEYAEVGTSSYYGGRDVFHGRKTSTGEVFSKNGLTAAHKTLPLPSIVRVTNLKNGRSIKLRINDRGPFVKNRIIDVSEKAAHLLGFHHDGIAKVRVECLVGESMQLARTYNPKTSNPYTAHGHHHGPSLKQAVGRTFQRVAVPRKPQSSHSPRSFEPPQKNRAMQASMTGPLPRGTYIQVGTYSSPNNAQAFANKVANRMRVSCRTVPEKNANGTYHRVLMGPMKGGQQAVTKMIHELKIRNVTDAFIVAQN